MPLPPATQSFGPFDAGDDIDCTVDTGKTFAVVKGLRNLGNALARRLTTARGSLLYDTSYGVDVRRYLKMGFTPALLAQVKSDIAAEVSKDERVQNPNVTVTVNLAAQTMQISVVSELAPGAPFELVFRVDALTVELLTVVTP